MTPQEYAEAQAVLSASAGAYVLKFANFVVDPLLNTAEWLVFLQLIFNEVNRLRTESASLARVFYDSERKIHNPTLPRHDVYLREYDFPTFVEKMEPTRKQLSQPRAPKQAVANVVMHTIREVENGGRQQIIASIEDDYQQLTADVPQEPEVKVAVKVEIVDKPSRATDPVRAQLERQIAEEAGTQLQPSRKAKKIAALYKPSGPVRGWARVATGKETCAFCLMLISRGPVYLSAQGAGLDLHDAGAAAALAQGDDVSQWMNQWHIGCDCKVIPVYDKVDWPGMYAAQRAMELWNEATTEASQVLKDNPGKKSFVKGEWVATTHNREAINSLRRRLDRGEISTSEFSALAA